MKRTSKEQIESILQIQKRFFNTNNTKDTDFRIDCLKRFRKGILKFEKKIAEALYSDLRKSYQEAYLTEIGLVINEIDLHLKNLKKWSKPKKVSTPLFLFPSSSYITPEPLGVALIIAPWNYPFQLLMNPLVGAISSGCCSVLKPSPSAPETARVIEDMMSEIFGYQYITTVTGGKETNKILLNQKFDVIFFTGSPAVGRVVMKAASKYLTPVILELGGKSPCIVDKDANLDIAAKRIAWGKCINAGQTCIAPDYLFVHESVKAAFVEKIKESIAKMYGEDIKSSPFYPRIVNENAFKRLSALLDEGTICYGGETDISDLYISPSIIENLTFESSAMQEEIFGPLLPLFSFSEISEVLKYINSGEKPLALYYFGKSEIAKEVLLKTSSGGACINDTIMHVSNHNLPFGGIGNSGMGKYHGKHSFDSFSNMRAVVCTPTRVDFPFKYPPYKYYSFIKRFFS